MKKATKDSKQIVRIRLDPNVYTALEKEGELIGLDIAEFIKLELGKRARDILDKKKKPSN